MKKNRLRLFHNFNFWKSRRSFGVFVFFVLTLPGLFGQSSNSGIWQLGEAIKNGTVTLTASGNGSSSGFAIDGSLKNNTQGEIRISIFLDGSLYLKNSGKGQNLVATQVFLSGGGYVSDGINNFIILHPGSTIGIVFDAYCADFDLDNPSSNESFSVAPLPPQISAIVSKICKYTTDHFDSESDHTTAAQLALWRSQGHTRTEISEKFNFDDEDWDLSTVIINY